MLLPIFGLILLIVFILFILNVYGTFQRIPRDQRICAGWSWLLIIPLVNIIMAWVLLYAILPNTVENYMTEKKFDALNLKKVQRLKTYGLIYAILMTASVVVGIVPLLGFFIGLGNIILFILYWIQLMDVKKALPQL